MLASVGDLVGAMKRGEMVIIVDDEDRENEGDLVIAAEHATPEMISFMAVHGRGLVCLTLLPQRSEELGLALQPRRHVGRLQTAFTVSIDARDGITTGISSADRARTIATAIDPKCDAHALSTPGHVFPLVGRPGGVLVRAGHTEASIDLAHMAGLYPAGVICEIMRDDGTMARLPDLYDFAAQHKLAIGSVASLVSHRRNVSAPIRFTSIQPFKSVFCGEGWWRIDCVQNIIGTGDIRHSALVRGESFALWLDAMASHASADTIMPVPPISEKVWVRVHKVQLDGDILQSDTAVTPALSKIVPAMERFSHAVVVVLHDNTLPPAPIREAATSATGSSSSLDFPPLAENQDNNLSVLRHTGVGSQILSMLGVRHMGVISETRPHVVAAQSYGLQVVDFLSFHDLFSQVS